MAILQILASSYQMACTDNGQANGKHSNKKYISDNTRPTQGQVCIESFFGTLQKNNQNYRMDS